MQQKIRHSFHMFLPLLFLFVAIVACFFVFQGISHAQTDPEQDGSIGLTGTISAPPPSTAATITVPTEGQSFTDVPVPVRGLCTDGLLVKLFKNNVFAGSVQCENGTFEIGVDLFTGTNELIARVFDDLDQPGPDSNAITVTFVDNREGAGTRVSVTSNFAKRGANPGQTLTWPITVSGGIGPYAFSVDWGDGKDPDLFSEVFPGNFDIQHVYDAAGVYNIVVKVSDSGGGTAFLQLVGVANGPLSQTNTDGSPLSSGGSGTAGDDGVTPFTGSDEPAVVWWPAAASVPSVILTFWFGKKYTVMMLKKRIERGEHPFADI